MTKLPISITIFILAALFLPAAIMAQGPVACEQSYSVQVGDWLSKLAEKYCGDVFAYPAIVAATNAQTDEAYATIADPDLIEPGWTLCIPSADDAAALMASSAGPGAGPQPAPEGLSQGELANATYQGIYEEPVTLTDGKYEGEPFVEGGASRPTVIFIPDPVAYGDLNGDGQDDAVVLLAENSGGSGTFVYLAAVANQDSQPVNMATTLLGDRVQVNSITIPDNQMVVDMVQAGPDDPMCCPSQQVIKTYELQGDQLVEISSQEVTGGAQAAGTLEGSSWILTSLNGTEPLPETTITASFGEDGTLNGTNGCNRYGAAYQVDGDNIAINLGPTTMMACPDPVMKQADDYMAALASAVTYQIQGDTLELSDAGGIVVATFTTQPTGLAGTSWNVLFYNNGTGGVVSVIIGTELTADFGQDGNLTGSAGCNNYTAAYEADDQGNISIGPAASTFMMCSDPEGIMEQEQEYLTALQSAATYRVEGNTMEMRTAEGSTAASFEMAN